jgi:hypothetical protein
VVRYGSIWRGKPRHGAALVGQGQARQGKPWWGMAGFGEVLMTTGATAIGGDVTNGATNAIAAGAPYIVRVNVVGTADLLFHRWNCDAVAEKSKAAKGSEGEAERRSRFTSIATTPANSRSLASICASH